MKIKNCRERGLYGIADTEKLTNETDKETKQAYMPFVKESIKNMLESGARYPFIKKVSGATFKFQLTGHLHLADALQGYWERNRKEYTHRAKSDYRALYIGTIHQLEEETYLNGYDNQKEIAELELYLEEKMHRHKANRNMSMLRAEVKTCITERTNKDISEEDFEDQMEELIQKYAKTTSEERAEKVLNDLILEEEKLAGGRGRTASWRDRRKKRLGLSVVGQEE
ncbi:MAG TPA: hypothetical protein ACFYEK_18075 [Candidatus Wunengus sp. YC60]|uniref:hypothetical protein n=1 Tax=Candidatus Wunengus sp. YC60 TaxID=3367697 RepID=UPI0040276107